MTTAQRTIAACWCPDRLRVPYGIVIGHPALVTTEPGMESTREGRTRQTPARRVAQARLAARPSALRMPSGTLDALR
jgi:hypothetical protein